MHTLYGYLDKVKKRAIFKFFRVTLRIWNSTRYHLRHFRPLSSVHLQNDQRKRGFVPSRFPQPYIRIFGSFMYIVVVCVWFQYISSHYRRFSSTIANIKGIDI